MTYGADRQSDDSKAENIANSVANAAHGFGKVKK